MRSLTIWVEREHEDVKLPSFGSVEAAGADLHAWLPNIRSRSLRPGERALVPTGLKLEIPKGYEGQVRPRSGLALKHGIGVLNAPGTIDSDYRGAVGVILINHGEQVFEIEHQMRIAQLVIAPVMRVTFSLLETLGETARGAGGFGSSGSF